MDVYKVENNENTMRGVVLAHDALMRSLRQMAALEEREDNISDIMRNIVDFGTSFSDFKLDCMHNATCS